MSILLLLFLFFRISTKIIVLLNYFLIKLSMINIVALKLTLVMSITRFNYNFIKKCNKRFFYLKMFCLNKDLLKVVIEKFYECTILKNFFIYLFILYIISTF